MTTPRTRFLVSFAFALTITLTLAGCAHTPSRVASNQLVPAEELPVTIGFENAARDYVHVYLVGVRREWFLGRVETGARATLRIPEEALAEDAGTMRLAVLEGQPRSVRVAGDARATTTITQPVTAILSQQWTFSQTASNWLLTSRLRRPLVR